MTDRRELPIPFSAPMVCAVLDGRKTQTRRIVRWPFKPDPQSDQLDNLGDFLSVVATGPTGKQHYVKCPYGIQGDRLWVRENYRLPGFLNADSPATVIARENPEDLRAVVEYVATPTHSNEGGKLRPAMFLPRALARLFLDVSAPPDMERVRDVTDAAARAEGIVEISPGYWGLPGWPEDDLQWNPRAAFLHLFFSLNTRAPRDSNPWVWVVHFKRA